MHQRLLTFLGAGLLALPGAALAAAHVGAPSAAPPTTSTSDDVPPKDDEKKDEVTVWVLDASGKG
jgi:hypothetical protein